MILQAHPIPPRHLPRGGHTTAQLKGLRYQRALTKAFKRSLSEDVTIIPEPWYQYTRKTSRGHIECNICAPDFVLTKDLTAIVIEVKLTFVYGAIEKLLDLYVPVITAAYPNLQRIMPLVVTHTITPSAPPTITRISQALDTKRQTVPVLQWLDRRSPLTW